MLTPRKGILSSRFRAYSLDANGYKKPVEVERENFYEGRVFGTCPRSSLLHSHSRISYCHLQQLSIIFVGETSSDVTMHYEDGLMTATITTPDDTYVVEV